MFTNTQSNLMMENKATALKPDDSPWVQELMTLGKEEVWDFAIVGQAPMPEKAVRLEDWLIVPAQQDSSEIPEQALARVEAIYRAGIRPKGFVLVHEAPMLLPAPEGTEVQRVEREWALDPETKEKIIEPLSFGVSALAKVVAGVVTLFVAAGAVVIPAIFMTAAALIDPILVVVTEDDYWIEIDRWWV